MLAVGQRFISQRSIENDTLKMLCIYVYSTYIYNLNKQKSSRRNRPSFKKGFTFRKFQCKRSVNARETSLAMSNWEFALASPKNWSSMNQHFWHHGIVQESVGKSTRALHLPPVEIFAPMYGIQSQTNYSIFQYCFADHWWSLKKKNLHNCDSGSLFTNQTRKFNSCTACYSSHGTQQSPSQPVARPPTEVVVSVAGHSRWECARCAQTSEAWVTRLAYSDMAQKKPRSWACSQQNNTW